MAEHIRDIKWAPTVAYIPSQALSAAAITALACDEIVIGKNARLGDAGVIQLDPVGQVFRYAPEKLRSDLVAFVRDLAEEHDRAPALAEAMVNMDLEVFRFENKTTGEIRLMSKEEVKASADPDEWKSVQLIHESREKHFFEVVGGRAVELGLAEATVSSINDLKTRYGAEEVIEFEATGVDTTVAILNSTSVTILLFIVGLVALYIEMASPGIGVGGLTSIICFAIFFWSRFLGGTAEWLEVILFIAGIILIGIELFVIPGFGVWGLSGLLLIAASLVLAGQDFVIPNSPEQWKIVRSSALALSASFLGFMTLAYFITARLGSIPILNRLALIPPSAESRMDGAPATPFDIPLNVGDQGVADSYLRPAGRAKFGDEYFDVVSDGTLVDAGAAVRVISVSGNLVVVREVT
jgi:membrane-bound serine protease (ClpP class)